MHLWVCFSDVDPGVAIPNTELDAAGGEDTCVRAPTCVRWVALVRWDPEGTPGQRRDREVFGKPQLTFSRGSLLCRSPRDISGVITPFLVEFKSLLKQE